MAAADTQLRPTGPHGAGRAFGVARGPLLAFVVILVIWELIARSGAFPPVLLPSVGRTAGRFWELLLDGTLFANTYATLLRMLMGYAMAIVVGIPAGLLMARFRVAEELGLPVVVFFMPIPSLALVPLFTIWFGLGGAATVALVFVSSSLPIALNTWNGARTLDPVYARVAFAAHISGWRLFTKVVFPAALPSILTGLRYGLSLAWRAVIAGELISVTGAGLGWMIFSAREYLRSDTMLSAIVMIAFLGILIERVAFAPVDKFTVVRWGWSRATALRAALATVLSRPRGGHRPAWRDFPETGGGRPNEPGVCARSHTSASSTRAPPREADNATASITAKARRPSASPTSTDALPPSTVTG